MFKKIEASNNHKPDVVAAIHRVRDIDAHCKKLRKSLAFEVHKLKESAVAAFNTAHNLGGNESAMLGVESAQSYKALLQVSNAYAARINNGW